MRVGLRAAAAVGLLVGFHVLALALVGGLIALNVVFAVHDVAGELRLAIISVPVIWAVLRGLFTIERAGNRTEPGLAVSPEEQPALWALVRRLADEVGTRPPDEIRFVLMVNAAVTEQTRWLGLRSVRRQMLIGVPLLAGLTKAELQAVLAHELGHYGNKDTRLGGITYAGMATISHAVANLAASRGYVQRALAWGFSKYRQLYFLVCRAVCRRQELDADQIAARLAGRAAAADCLRAMPGLLVAWQVFMRHYVTVAWDAGYLPEEVMAGFVTLLADPDRRHQFEELRAAPQAEEISKYDSHPPTERRIALIEALPDTPAPADGDRPAVDVVTGSTTTLDAVFQASLVAEADGKRRVSWAALAAVVAGAAVGEPGRALLTAAARTSPGPATLGTVLDALDAGRLVELGADLVPAKEGESPRARREICRWPVAKGLVALTTLALVDAGRGSWRMSWSDEGSVVLDLPGKDDLDALTELADAAVMDSADATAGLRRWLADTGIDLTYRPMPN
jgi:Zn-dependent protease with chaperone function